MLKERVQILCIKGVQIGFSKTSCDEGRWMKLTRCSVKLRIFVMIPPPEEKEKLTVPSSTVNTAL